MSVSGINSLFSVHIAAQTFQGGPSWWCSWGHNRKCALWPDWMVAVTMNRGQVLDWLCPSCYPNDTCYEHFSNPWTLRAWSLLQEAQDIRQVSPCPGRQSIGVYILMHYGQFRAADLPNHINMKRTCKLLVHGARLRFWLGPLKEWGCCLAHHVSPLMGRPLYAAPWFALSCKHPITWCLYVTPQSWGNIISCLWT